MQVTVQHTNVCEADHKPHDPPLLEVLEDVLDIATDKESGIIMIRMERSVLQLNRACVLEMKVVI